MTTGALPEGFRPANCSFSDDDWPVLAAQWFPVARADAVLPKPVQLVLLDVRLAVYRMRDGVRVGRDMCPHRGLPLTTGRIEGDELVCAYHGLRFGPDGQCRKTPEKLALKTPECLRISMFPVVDRHDLIWTCLMPDGEPKIPSVKYETSEVLQNGFSLPIKLHNEVFMDVEKLDFSDNHFALRKIALNEYRKLFTAMGLSMQLDGECI